MSMHSAKRLVLTANEVPADCAERAQLAIVTASAWHIYGPVRCHSYDKEAMPLPKLKCPVLDISGLSDEADEKVGALLAKHMGESGLVNVGELVKGLQALGAAVTNELGSKGWFALVTEEPLE